MKTKIFFGAMVFDSASHSFVPRTVVCANGVITDLLLPDTPPPEGERIDCTGRYIIPGLVDVHTHGRNGIDFTEVTEEMLAELTVQYAKTGTTAVMVTPASAPYEEWLKTAVCTANHIRQKHPGARLLGVHFEGRYLSSEKRGAHNPSLLTAPSVEELHEILRLLKDVRVHFSAAPETDGCKAFVQEAVRLGASVGIAHTNCTYEQALEAVTWGAISFTHTFNAMTAISHRAPGCMIAALLSDDAYAELICDGLHSHPAMTSLLVRNKPRDRVVLITDSGMFAGLPDGHYFSAGLEVVLADGKCTTLDGALAGSTLTLFDAVKNCMRFTGLPLTEVLPFATVNPARMVGADGKIGTIEVGKSADLLLIDNQEDPSLQAVYCGGDAIQL